MSHGGAMSCCGPGALCAGGVIGRILSGSSDWLWLLVAGLPMLALALADLTQRSHSLRRNYPGAARFRWLFESLRPFSRAYLVEGDLDGRPFTHEERDLVYARAHGTADAHPSAPSSMSIPTSTNGWPTPWPPTPMPIPICG
jgi:hypothetical protein